MAHPNHEAPLSVGVGRRGALADDSETALVTLQVRCPPGSEVLESFLYLVQDGEQTAFAPFTPDCDRPVERIVVAVPAGSAELEAGTANVSGYLLLSTGEAVNITGEVRLTPFAGDPGTGGAHSDGWIFA
jgi:hypothetical protein